MNLGERKLRRVMAAQGFWRRDDECAGVRRCGHAASAPTGEWLDGREEPAC